MEREAAGLLVLALCWRGLIRARTEVAEATARAATPAVFTIGVLLMLSLSLGYVHWAPKWTMQFWLWATANLLSTCMSEEAFFRGFIQAELSKLLARMKLGPTVAILCSGLLFGLAHLAGGWTYVGVAAVAGVGYAFVFQRTRRVEMSMLTHFSLNAIHFLLFTYPYAST
jgi:membrane protease YdiL (CAAX protease family)